ncbi:lysozyme [Pantoea agglomerans]|uniref:lysozyme n=1 Tax=Enterobacter agglomerans TaxID=549 RepID=UPI000B7A0475|nr:lysozyme [Pantoea agglomerans]OXH80180.1 glycoside hydrolase [Pantoea agglomerans]
MSQTVKRCAVVAVLAIAALLPQFKTLKTSEAGLALIANAEGCRTSPYQCSAGVWTNGIGHTDGVTPQSQVSERQAAVNLVYDVMRVERGIDVCMAVEMPQRVYDATVSFAFNVGVRAACSSTFARYIRQQHWFAACSELRRWVYVNGVKNRGLENRRANETAYCLRGVL